MCLMWITASIIFLLDFLIKAYLRANLLNSSLPVIKNIFHITVITNTGAAFGILQGQSGFLAFLGIAFILIFIVLVRKENKKSKSFLIPCGLILGGAISNLYDRIVLGSVTDYIDLQIWPVFNLSDSCITIGVILLLWQSCREKATKCKKL